MSEQQGRRFGDNNDRGRGGRGGRGNARGGRGPRGGNRGGRGGEEGAWTPVTRLGRLVKKGDIKTLDEIFANSWPIKEVQIVDYLTDGGKNLKTETMKVMPVQKQTTAGQRMRMKCWVLVGDGKGHVGLGSKAHKELQIAIQAATNRAKMAILPVRMGYWGNKINQPHTVPMKVSGKEGSVRVRLVPAPRGTGIVAPYASKKVLEFAGVVDCYTQSRGSTRTKGNFLYATFHALSHTSHYLTPEFWGRAYVEDKEKLQEDDDEDYEDDDL